MAGRAGRFTAGTIGVLLGLAVGIAPVTAASAGANGTDPVSPLIVGGVDATQAYPPVASVQVDRGGGIFGHSCGATLVHHRYVVTAAHCVTTFEPIGPVDPATLRVRVGSAKHAEGGRLVAVTEVLPHPGWDWDTGDGDVALLRLDRSVWLPRYPIVGRSPVDGTTVRAVGWGSMLPSGAGPLPEILQEVDVQVQPPADCAGTVGINVDEICVWSATGNACYGDSGGPLLRRIGRTWSLIGASSRIAGDWTVGVQCGDPAIYTDLTAYRSWIARTVRS